MKFSQVLCSQHIGRQFKNFWRNQRHRAILNTGAEQVLKEKGIPVYEYEDIIKDIPELESKIVEFQEDLKVEDESNNPLWNPRPCYLYKNHSSLLEGLDQAKSLTNTVEIEEGLPSKFQLFTDKSKHVLDEKLVKRCVMSSHVFDATQQKLPKLHDPERPTWVFPRVYGIVDKRRCRLMCLSLANLCQLARRSKNIQPMFLLESEDISVPLEKDGNLIQLECRADLMLMTREPLSPIADTDVVKGTVDIPLPDLYPIKPTVSLLKENLYSLQDVFPLQPNTSNASLHTVFFHYNETEVKNLYDLPVTEEQFMGRSLVHTFAAAAAQARHLLKDILPSWNIVCAGSRCSKAHYSKYWYSEQKRATNSLGNLDGLPLQNDNSDLEHPITLQSIHTDGKRFHFSVFQLNTLNLNGDSGIKNIIWHAPVCNIFEECCYKEGRPELLGYNEDVARKTLAFFMNC